MNKIENAEELLLYIKKDGCPIGFDKLEAHCIAISEDLDTCISTFTVHKILTIKKTCKLVKEECIIGYQARSVACKIHFFLTWF